MQYLRDRQGSARDSGCPSQAIKLVRGSQGPTYSLSNQFLPNFAFAELTHETFASPASASHFSIVTL